MSASTLPVVPTTPESVCAEHDLLRLDDRGCIRVPMLIRGELRVPDRVDFESIRRAFEAADDASALTSTPSRVAIGDVQVLRKTARGTTVYTVLPSFDPREVIETRPDTLASELYDLPFERVLSHCKAIATTLANSAPLLERVREATRPLAELPDAWHDASFDSLADTIDLTALRESVDLELSRDGIEGSRFLDEWVSLTARVTSAPVERIAERAGIHRGRTTERVALRAQGTRQLHITAGNAPQIPLISALRAFATKSAAVLKSPSDATVPGALLALAAWCAEPDHPLTRNLSVVYWPGGDVRFETQLFAPGAFDRIVVWGDPEAVASVKAKAGLTKVLTFNPRYSLSFIGHEALADEALRTEAAERAATDSLVANQKACIASQVHYVEGTLDEARAYGRSLQKVLARFDEVAAQTVGDRIEGALKRLRRGRFLEADWLVNEHDGRFQSGVVVTAEEFPVTCHPMSRIVFVRPVPDLADALRFLHPAVATVGIFPQSRRLELRNRIAACGVSNVVELGTAGQLWPGMAHDGMRVLSELVDWKNG